MNEFLDRINWIPAVQVDGDPRSYGGALLVPDGQHVSALAVLVHGIAGDVGESAYSNCEDRLRAVIALV